MGIIGRLGQWAEIRRVRPVEESPDVAAGREGELALRAMLGASYRFGEATVLAGRRIPSRRQGRRREIDLIVCTPRMIHLIEAKNWSGRLEVDGGGWRQTRRGGDVVHHGDLLAEQRLRREAVIEYLDECGLDLDDRFARDHVAAEVVFTNPRLELDPAVEALPEVISRRELDGYLGRERRRGVAERMAASVFALCRDRESRGLGDRATPAAIPPERYARIVETLAEVTTWDRLEFHGTRIAAGDLISVKVGARTYRRPELLELSGRRPIRLRWERGRALGLFKAVTGLGPLGRLDLGPTRAALSADDEVIFHAVGEREPGAFKLVAIDRMLLG